MIFSPLAMMLRDNPIVVTGMGCISAAGCSPDELWATAVRGESPAVWREYGTASGVRRFPVCDSPDLESMRAVLHPVRRNDRCVQLAWLAARQAWLQAKLDDSPPSRT